MRGYQFMRQKPIGEFIVDFFCSTLKLITEIDGEASHRFKLTEDMDRQDWLEKLGLSVLRFSENQVRNDIQSVLYTLEQWIIRKEKDLS